MFEWIDWSERTLSFNKSNIYRQFLARNEKFVKLKSCKDQLVKERERAIERRLINDSLISNKYF